MGWDEIFELWDGMGWDEMFLSLGWDGMRFLSSGMGRDFLRVGWDETLQLDGITVELEDLDSQLDGCVLNYEKNRNMQVNEVLYVGHK